MMMRTLLSLALLSLAAALTAQPNPYGCHYFRNLPGQREPLTAAQLKSINASIARSDTFDILHYDIAIDVTNYSGQQITASTTVTFTPLMPGQDFIRFDLFQLPVDSVTDPNGPLTFSYDQEIVKVDLPSPPALGDTLMVTVHYHGSPHRDPDWGGFYFESNYIYNLGIGLSTIPPNFGKVWYPCFDSFVERASYTYHVKSAGTFRAHCQGNFIGEIVLGGDTVIRSYDFPQSIPTHLSAIAVADYQEHAYTHMGAYGPVPVTLRAKPANLNAMISKFASLDGAIDACEYWYGPHAFESVGYVLTTDGALEIPTNIAYPDFMPGQNLQSNQDLYSHELGHHWWGDVVTPHDHHDMWIKEGPAEYTGHLVEEWVGTPADFEKIVKDNQYYVLKNAHVQDGGFQPLSPMPDQYIYGLTTYYKGAAVLHNLRGYLGDTLFRQGMSTVQADHGFGTLTAMEFKDALEDATGQDLDPFFDAQVFAPGFSVFVVRSMSAQNVGGGWNVDLNVRQRLRGTSAFHHQVPLDVTLIGANWQREEFQMVADGEFTNVSFNAGFEPVMAVLNGHNRLNQARMDHEFVMRPGVGFGALLPRTDFRLYPGTLADSALVRVEHIWAGPDHDAIGWGIQEVSDTHYWIVDGVWPAGTKPNAQLYYYGNTAYALDHDLFNVTEADARVVYRATPQDPWEIFPYQTPFLNILTNGTGYIRIDTLLRGEYAFANATGLVGLEEFGHATDALHVHPVPASDQITIRGTTGGTTTATLDVRSLDGRLVRSASHLVKNAFEIRVNVSDLSPGLYLVDVRSEVGERIGTGRFEVVR